MCVKLNIVLQAETQLTRFGQTTKIILLYQVMH